MYRKLFIVFLLFIFASQAIASPSDCIRIDNDLDRLACYDKETGRTPKLKSIPNNASAWKITTEKSKLTDQTSVYLYVESDEKVNCGWNRGNRISLWIRCVENKTALIFQTGCHMTSSEYNTYGDVIYRLDSEPAKTASMSESTNHKSLGLWNGGASIPVIKNIFEKNTLIARMTPFSQNSFTATFNVAGLKESIKPLREACGW